MRRAAWIIFGGVLAALAVECVIVRGATRGYGQREPVMVPSHPTNAPGWHR